MGRAAHTAPAPLQRTPWQCYLHLKTPATRRWCSGAASGAACAGLRWGSRSAECGCGRAQAPGAASWPSLGPTWRDRASGSTSAPALGAAPPPAAPRSPCCCTVRHAACSVEGRGGCSLCVAGADTPCRQAQTVRRARRWRLLARRARPRRHGCVPRCWRPGRAAGCRPPVHSVTVALQPFQAPARMHGSPCPWRRRAHSQALQCLAGAAGAAGGGGGLFGAAGAAAALPGRRMARGGRGAAPQPGRTWVVVRERSAMVSRPVVRRAQSGADRSGKTQRHIGFAKGPPFHY